MSAFHITSGVSEWSVVEEFLRYYNGLTPRFDRMGQLLLDRRETDRHGGGRPDGGIRPGVPP